MVARPARTEQANGHLGLFHRPSLPAPGPVCVSAALVGGTYNGLDALERRSATNTGNHLPQIVRDIPGVALRADGFGPVCQRCGRAVGAAIPKRPDGFLPAAAFISRRSGRDGRLLYCVPGYANAVENIISVGGVDHLVNCRDWYRTGYSDYWALNRVMRVR